MTHVATPIAAGRSEPDVQVGRGWRFWAMAVVVAAAGFLLVVLVGTTARVWVIEPASKRQVEIVAVLVGALGAVLICLLWRRHPAAAAAWGLGALSAGVSGLLEVSLRGTFWATNGIFGDQLFRSAAAETYAVHVRLLDYYYPSLPAYYPPLIGWVEGRFADLTGVPGWQALKPVELVVGALVPLLSFALWRRVIGPGPALAIVGTVSLTLAHPEKIDEWLVLALLVPWWLEVVRSVRAPGVRPWQGWQYGLVLGFLLLTHTYYFLPVGVATVLAVTVALVRRPGMLRRWPFPLLVGVVGLVVSAVYWSPVVLRRLSGAPTDSFGLQYTPRQPLFPPLPVPTTVLGTLGLFFGCWLLLRSYQRARWGRSLSEPLVSLLYLLVGGLLTIGAGMAGLPVLGFKAVPLVQDVYAVGGVLALAAAARLLSRGRGSRGSHTRTPATDGHLRRLVPTIVPAVAVALVIGSSTSAFVREWVVGAAAADSATMVYPDGQQPLAARGAPAPRGSSPSGASVDAVMAALRRTSGVSDLQGRVLLSSRPDVFATKPVSAYVAFWSIYSNPFGQFAQRVAYLQGLGRCPSAACLAAGLRASPFGPVDGLVLFLQPGGLNALLVLCLSRVGEPSARLVIKFSTANFQSPYFRSDRVGSNLVVSPTTAALPSAQQFGAR